MKTVWILTCESVQIGRYGKQIIGVFANRKDAIEELESVKKDLKETGIVTIDTSTSFEISTTGKVTYCCIEHFYIYGGSV